MSATVKDGENLDFVVSNEVLHAVILEARNGSAADVRKADTMKESVGRQALDDEINFVEKVVA